MDANAVTINCFAELSQAEQRAIVPDIDRIFFDSSLRRAFDSDGDRTAFRDLWMGQYLRKFPDLFFVARFDTRAVGYLAGYFPSPDRPMNFSGQHHMSIFEDLLERYPAHLHINLAEEARSRGIGIRLIDAFVAQCCAASLTGVHIVTGKGSRNNTFYRRAGFVDEVPRSSAGTDLLFMGRPL